MPYDPNRGWYETTAVESDAHLDNLTATVPPTAANDETEGYSVGSRWFDLVAQEAYTATKVDEGMANWEQTTFTADTAALLAVTAIQAADLASSDHTHDLSEAPDQAIANTGGHYEAATQTTYLRPGSDVGSSGSASPVGAATMWEAIDDAVANTSAYVLSGGTGAFWFGLDSSLLPAGSVIERIRLFSSKYAPAANFGGSVKWRRADGSLSNNVESWSQNPTRDTYSGWYDTNPFTGLAWTEQDVRDLQVRYDHGSLGSQRIYTSWVEVEYSAPVSINDALETLGANTYTDSDAFPTSPTTGMRCRRTDLDYEVYFYDGTRWVSETIYTADMQPGDKAQDTGVAGAFGRWLIPYNGSVWLMHQTAWYLPKNTNDGSNYWTMTTRNIIDSFSTVTSFDSSADAPNTNNRSITTIDAVLDASTDYVLDLYCTITGTVDTLRVVGTITYRRIAT